jgi:uncharacterized protein VirK/YbjX
VIKIVLWLASYLPQRLIHKSPSALARKLWIVATNLRTQLRFFQVLSRPGFEEFFHRFPSVAYKYTEPNDLARSFTAAMRASSHLHHYSFLQARLSPSSLRQVLNRAIRLFEICADGHTFVIDLCAALEGDYEGELLMNFLADGVEIFILSFTFVSGSVVGSSAKNAILISCNQGTQGAQAAMGVANRALLGVCPQALLVSALEGIAESLGISQIVCVSAANQATGSRNAHSSFAQKYDEFFESWGANFANPGFYTLPVPFPQKPLQEIKQSHRQRTRKRRALKDLVSLQASRALLPALINGASPLPEAKPAPQAAPCLESLTDAPR